MVAGRGAAGAALAATFLAGAAASLALAWFVRTPAPSSRRALATYARVLPWDVVHRRALARADLAGGRPRRARARLRATLPRAPLAAPLWVDAAEAALHAGRWREARRMALRGASLAPADGESCGRAALVLLQANDLEAAVGPLRCEVENLSERLPRVLDLAAEVYPRVHDLLRVLPPGDAWLRALLQWAYGRGRAEAAAVGWETLAASGATAADRIRHVEFLLRRGEVDGAEAVWRPVWGPRPPGTVFDGGFETDVAGGFGWRIARTGAAAVTLDASASLEGRRGLRIEFRGGNPDFDGPSQVVPVEAGRRHVLTAMVRGEGITSAAGPRPRVGPHASCPAMGRVEGADVRGTTRWRRVAVEFDVPADCRAVVVSFARPPTARLDREIRGVFAADAVSLAVRSDGQ